MPTKARAFARLRVTHATQRALKNPASTARVWMDSMLAIQKRRIGPHANPPRLSLPHRPARRLLARSPYPAPGPGRLTTMADTVKLQLSLSPALVRAVRLFLAEQDRGKKGELSEFFAELTRERLSQWIQERAQATGHAAELSPGRVAAAVQHRQAQRAQAEERVAPPSGDPAPATASAAPTPPVRVVFSDDELDALSASVQRWASP